jgi:hypothetical protein
MKELTEADTQAIRDEVKRECESTRLSTEAADAVACRWIKRGYSASDTYDTAYAAIDSVDDQE